MKSANRANSMTIHVKDDSVKDILSVYFNHPVWKRGWGNPVPDMPLDVQLELVNRCNLSCESCPILKQTRAKSILTWDVLQRIVDEAAVEGVCYFTICGIGEAALHPNLFQLLSYIRSRKVEPKGLRALSMMPSLLVSNAVWNNRQVEECIENPPDLLSLSLAGLTDEEIVRRRQPINLDLFYRNVKKIYQERKVRRDEDGGVSPTIHISTHVYPSEMNDTKAIEAFKEKWFEICDIVVIKPTMLDEHHKEFKKFLGEKELVYTDISEKHYERTAPCMEVSRRLSVDSDGNVWCGHHNSEDFGDKLGNVYSQSLREIWHSEKMNQFRREVRAGIFKRPGCKACGGEIRDWNRSPQKKMEDEITFD